MRPYAFACLLALASFTLVAGACNFKLGSDTEGEMGNLRFSYSGSGCFFGCGLDKKVLQGGKVTVDVKGDTQGGLTAVIDDGSPAAVATQTETCTCNSGSSSSTHSRIVQGGVSCESGESRTCSMNIEVAGTSEGFSKLKVLDAKGAVIDQVDITVRSAARLDLAVTANDVAVQPRDGVYDVKVRASGKVAVKAFDGDGDELYWSRDGITFTFDGQRILEESGGAFFRGSSDSFRPLAAGDATIDVSAPGGSAHSTARFHVTP